MKKMICLLLALCLCALGACAAAEDIAVRFDEGFSLDLPEGWVSYPISDPEIRYALGDGSGERYLYILAQPAAFETLRRCRPRWTPGRTWARPACWT